VTSAARTAGSTLALACSALAAGCSTTGAGRPPSARQASVLRPATPPAGRTARASYAPWPAGHDAQVIWPGPDTGATVDSYPALAADGTLLVGTEGGDLLAIGGRR